MKEISFFEIIMIAAIFLGPVFAVRLTRHLDNKKETQGRKLEIFKSLMATRSYITSWRHVEALNLIELEFGKEKEVIDAWKIYLKHLGKANIPTEQWAVKRDELLTDLLQKMSDSLGYHFNQADIQSWYSPKAHEAEEEWNRIYRHALIKVLRGESSLSMAPATWLPKNEKGDQNGQGS